MGLEPVCEASLPVGRTGEVAIRRAGPIRRTPTRCGAARNMQATRWPGRAEEGATSPAQPSLKSRSPTSWNAGQPTPGWAGGLEANGSQRARRRQIGHLDLEADSPQVA